MLNSFYTVGHSLHLDENNGFQMVDRFVHLVWFISAAILPTPITIRQVHCGFKSWNFTQEGGNAFCTSNMPHSNDLCKSTESELYFV